MWAYTKEKGVLPNQCMLLIEFKSIGEYELNIVCEVKRSGIFLAFEMLLGTQWACVEGRHV